MTAMNATATITFCGMEMDEGRRLALERLFSRISDVASLPTTAQKLLELTALDTPPVDEIRDVIETDPALLANLLRRVNSGYYGLATKVSDARSAIALLGMQEIRNLAATIFLSKFYDQPSDHGPYRRTQLWDHCVAVGTTSRMIARQTHRCVPEEAYVAGLLHDFGFILLDQFLHKHFCMVLDQLDEHTATHEVENRILTFDHAMLGGFVAHKWCFPQPAIDAITFHHRPLDYHGDHAATLHAVVLANWLCSDLGRLSLGVNNLPQPEPEVFHGLGLDDASLCDLRTQLEQEFEKAAGMATA
jgi:HD-like signal output (HDOD) protein